MDRKILRFPGGCAVTEDGQLVEYLDLQGSSQSGDIVMGRIDRMMPGLACAFTDIGRKKDGFLPLRENSESFAGKELRSGERIPVQIRREETGEKGAFLSRDVTISGRYVILMPMNRHIGVSSRITDEIKRENLRQLGTQIAGGKTGLVMRAASADAQEEMIRQETAELAEEWKNVLKRQEGNVNPGEILYTSDPVSRIMKDYGEYTITDLPDIPCVIRQAVSAGSSRKVSMKSGGNLIIDCCEALTVIDVNSASYAGEGNKEKSVTAINLEACEAAAVQIRLRDISGIILIDFIDMERESDQEMVEQRLRRAFSADRRKTVIHGWTRLGLMEMTRKRV